MTDLDNCLNVSPMKRQIPLSNIGNSNQLAKFKPNINQRNQKGNSSILGKTQSPYSNQKQNANGSCSRSGRKEGCFMKKGT